MIMRMEIVVNDTNILIDLYESGLLKYCDAVKLEFHTLDMIVEEVEEVNQRTAVDELVERGVLKVKSLSGEQMTTLMQKIDENDGKCNLSPEDISVMIYAKENGYRLLTGDKTLRKAAMLENVTVSGILFLTNKMIDDNVISGPEMADALERMIGTNKRLPLKQIREKIDELRS